MEIKKVAAVYFSGTGTTKETVLRIADNIARALHVPLADLSFTLPQARQQEVVFSADTLVICGTPTYAGRVPNLLLPYLKEKLSGGGALAVPVVLFGNRSYDDALMELRNILEADGFHTIAGAAFVGEHSFSTTLGAGRPNKEDEELMDSFSHQIVGKVKALSAAPAEPVMVGGHDPIRPYYTPRDRNSNPINILKVKPKTDPARCDRCGWCAANCPMGSIDFNDPANVTGVCIKCCACVKGCHTGAKYYDDAGYLYHKSELEEIYARPAEVETFI